MIKVCTRATALVLNWAQSLYLTSYITLECGRQVHCGLVYHTQVQPISAPNAITWVLTWSYTLLMYRHVVVAFSHRKVVEWLLHCSTQNDSAHDLVLPPPSHPWSELSWGKFLHVWSCGLLIQRHIPFLLAAWILIAVGLVFVLPLPLLGLKWIWRSWRKKRCFVTCKYAYSFSFTEFVLTVQGMEPGKLTRDLKQYIIMHIQYIYSV